MTNSKFKVEIHCNGAIFKGKQTDTCSIIEAKDTMFELMGEIDKIELELEGGGFIVMGKVALQSAIFIFKEV